MNPRIKAGITGGIFGLVISIVSGGQVAVLAGIIAGMISGLLVVQREHLSRQIDGFRQGVQAGLVAGVLVLIGQMFRGIAINPVVDPTNTALPGLFITGLGGLFLAGVVAAAFTTISTLKAPRDRIGTYALIGILVLAYPWIDRALSLNFMNEVIPVLVFILMALGLNIVVGYAGLLDLGYAAFFAIGAYTTGMLASPWFDVNMSFWLAIWIAAAVASIFGIILGAPTLPLRGDYLALVTLGFGEIVPIAIRNLDSFSISILGFQVVSNIDLTGGPKGINPINRPSFFGYSFTPAQPIPWYYLIIGIMIFSIFFILRLRNSRLGRAWTAMREDELAAEAMGINIVKTKLLAFAMGATFSGFAGAFYASYISAIFPESFRFDVSVMLLCMVILGGLGNISGVILGGLIIQFADRLFLPQFSKMVQTLVQSSDVSWLKEVNFQSDFRLLLFGLTLVIMMLVRPEGLVPSERRKLELHDEEVDTTLDSAEMQAANTSGS